MKKIISMIYAVILVLIITGCAAQDALRDQQAQKIQDQIDQANAAKEAAKEAKLKKIRGDVRAPVATVPNAAVNSPMSTGIPAVPSLPSLIPRSAVQPAQPSSSTGQSVQPTSKQSAQPSSKPSKKPAPSSSSTPINQLAQPSVGDPAAASGDTTNKADIANPGN